MDSFRQNCYEKFTKSKDNNKDNKDKYCPLSYITFIRRGPLANRLHYGEYSLLLNNPLTNNNNIETSSIISYSRSDQRSKEYNKISNNTTTNNNDDNDSNYSLTNISCIEEEENTLDTNNIIRSNTPIINNTNTPNKKRHLSMNSNNNKSSKTEGIAFNDSYIAAINAATTSMNSSNELQLKSERINALKSMIELTTGEEKTGYEEQLKNLYKNIINKI